MPSSDGDLGRLLALDLEVPQHHLPALGQAGERPGGRAALEGGHRRVLEGHPRVEVRHVVGGLQLGRGPHLVHVQPAYGGEQVGAERDVGAAAALEHGEHLGERLGDQVVGVGAADELTAEPGGGVHVPGEELAVGSDVPARGRARSARRRWACRCRSGCRSWSSPGVVAGPGRGFDPGRDALAGITVDRRGALCGADRRKTRRAVSWRKVRKSCRNSRHEPVWGPFHPATGRRRRAAHGAQTTGEGVTFAMAMFTSFSRRRAETAPGARPGGTARGGAADAADALRGGRGGPGRPAGT